jgi:hypothetical protein
MDERGGGEGDREWGPKTRYNTNGHLGDVVQVGMSVHGQPQEIVDMANEYKPFQPDQVQCQYYRFELYLF